MDDQNTFALALYSDGSGPRLAVRKGIELEDGPTVMIEAVGGNVLVHPEDIDLLIRGLRSFQLAAE